MISLSIGARALFITVSAVMLLVLYFYSVGKASNTLNFVGVLLLTTTSFFILKSRGGWTFLLYGFGLTFALASGALIEFTEAFLIEVQETAYLTGAAARNAFLASFFLVTAYAAYKLFLRLIPNKLTTIRTAETLATRLLLAIAFVAPFYISAVLITYGSPLFLGIDRFGYFTSIAPPGYVWVYGNIPLLGFAVALAAYKGFIRHRTSIIWLTFTVVTYILAGEKFSQLFLVGFFFFLPFFLIRSPCIKTKHMLIGGVAVLAMAALVVINYTVIYGSTEILVPRLALQGQMNYALDKITESVQPLNALITHLAGFGVHEKDHGLPYLMYLVAPSNVVDMRLEQGATFTAPFPSNIVYFFGRHFTPIFIIPLAVITGAISALIYRSTISQNIILSMLALKTFLLTYVAIMMGGIDLLLGLKAVIHFMAIFIYLIVAHIFTRQSA